MAGKKRLTVKGVDNLYRILAAGDLNTMFGVTEENPAAMPVREKTILDRMNALGLEYMGPEYPNGRRA